MPHGQTSGQNGIGQRNKEKSSLPERRSEGKILDSDMIVNRLTQIDFVMVGVEDLVLQKLHALVGD